jgi:hypothetical protein
MIRGLQSGLTGLSLTATLALLLSTAGCVRRDGRNSDCRWPAETAKHPADAGHLSADAEFAEDLAIRYADTHHGRRTPYYVSGEDYVAARDRCKASLFEEIAKEHGVPAATVAKSLGQNRAGIDIAEILPFVLLYCIGAAAVARTVWRLYPPAENGWLPGAVMLLFVSVVFAAGGVLAGEVWCWVVECNRIGNSHMSDRVQRLWWVRHRAELFLYATIMSWAAGAWAARRLRSNYPLPKAKP